jgi:hypothetical protein
MTCPENCCFPLVCFSQNFDHARPCDGVDLKRTRILYNTHYPKPSRFPAHVPCPLFIFPKTYFAQNQVGEGFGKGRKSLPLPLSEKILARTMLCYCFFSLKLKCPRAHGGRRSGEKKVSTFSTIKFSSMESMCVPSIPFPERKTRIVPNHGDGRLGEKRERERQSILSKNK